MFVLVLQVSWGCMYHSEPSWTALVTQLSVNQQTTCIRFSDITSKYQSITLVTCTEVQFALQFAFLRAHASYHQT